VVMAVKHIFRHWLPDEIKDALRDLPPGLKELYDTLFDAMKEPPRHAQLAQRVLKGLIAQAVPLPSRLFLQTVNFSKDINIESITAEHVVEVCKFFVDYNRATDSFDFSHASVIDYFNEHRQKEFSKGMAHCLLASTCLNMIGDKSYNAMCYTTLESELELKYFAGYATICWAWHILNVDEDKSTMWEIEHRLEAFYVRSCENHGYLAWTRNFGILFGNHIPYELGSHIPVPFQLRRLWLETMVISGKPDPFLTSLIFNFRGFLKGDDQGFFLINLVSERQETLEDHIPESGADEVGRAKAMLLVRFLDRQNTLPATAQEPLILGLRIDENIRQIESWLETESCVGVGSPHLMRELLGFLPLEYFPLRFQLQAPCVHTLYIKPNQSTESHCACYCINCHYHFDVLVDYDSFIDKPDVCGNERADHHLQLLGSVPNPPMDEKNSLGRYQISWKIFYFRCSQPSCQAMVKIMVSSPRVDDRLLSVITDQTVLRERVARVVATDPDRYIHMRTGSLNPLDALVHLSIYLQDRLVAGSKGRSIAVRNKRFYLVFAEDCVDLLHYLGFAYKLHDSEDDPVSHVHAS